MLTEVTEFETNKATWLCTGLINDGTRPRKKTKNNKQYKIEWALKNVKNRKQRLESGDTT